MWVDDYRGMKGIYTWKNGNVYDGEWKTDERNGKGVQKFANGESYSGNWDLDAYARLRRV
jgi:hypothetical protein